MKGIVMEPAKASNQIGMAGWLSVIAVLLSVTGCGHTTTYPGLLSSEQESQARAAAAGPDSALKVARATHQSGDLAASIQLYRTLVGNGSVAPEVVVEFGDVLVESGSPDEAIDVYSQIDARSPARSGALLGMTRAYLNLEDPVKALNYADEVLAPRDARILIDKGVALDSLGRHAEAQALYRRVLSVTPRHVAARNDLALSLALTGQYDEAIALIGPLVRSSTATPRERENLAIIYGLMGDGDRATMLSRVDLDEGTTRANLAFLAAVRGTKP
jgi:Flp pilus assembly protein TadD